MKGGCAKQIRQQARAEGRRGPLELMRFRELADALRSDPEVQRRFTEAIEKARVTMRASTVPDTGPSVEQVLDAWYRRHGWS